MLEWLRGLEELHSQPGCLLSLKIPWYIQLVEFLIALSQMFTSLLIIKLAHKLESKIFL